MRNTDNKNMTTLDSLVEQGKRFMGENDLPSAREAFSGAVALAETEYGSQANELIEPLWWLAKAYRAHKYSPCPEMGEAISAVERAISIAEVSSGDEPRLEVLLTFFGVSLWFNGRHERAIEAISRARDVRATWSTDTREQTRILSEILLHSAGRAEDALTNARQLLQQEKDMGGGPSLYAEFLMADCLRQAGGREVEACSFMVAFLERTSDAATSDDEVKAIVRGWLDELKERLHVDVSKADPLLERKQES
jgi:hypothetical protein